MTDQHPSPPAYPHDPDAPYFETLYALACTVASDQGRPVPTREAVLEEIRQADPDNTLRITEPYDPAGD